MIRIAFLCLALSSLSLATLGSAARNTGESPAERGLERELAAGSALPPATGASVAPGLVRWHADFDAACAAARVSGKPVLLFQLLGRLDDELC